MARKPLDVLADATDGDVRVRLKSGEVFFGALSGYDEHMNLVLGPATEPLTEESQATPVEDTMVIRGDNVVSITP